MYGLTQQERKEMDTLMTKFTYSNGVMNKEKLADNPIEGAKLKSLLVKRKELLQASMN